MHQSRNIGSSSLPNGSTAMKARRPYVGGLAIIFLIVLLMLLVVYSCARGQEQSSLSQTQETHRAPGEQVSQPDSKPGESDRVRIGSQQTSEGHPQEVNQVSNRTIEEVKADWEERLMAMPGVMGVGIGLTQDRQRTCIKVYVNRQSPAPTAQIPQEIEGYPVEVEVRKPFRAL
jgi:uncharacterized membrane protein